MTRTVAVTGQTTASPSARRTTATRSTTTSPAANRNTTTKPAASRSGGRGMSAMKTSMKKSGGDFNRLTINEGTTYVIAFLEDGPIDVGPDGVVWKHWVKVKGEDGRSSRAVRNCPTTVDEDAECPLCELQIEAKPTAYFNVVDLDQPGKVFLWEAGKDASGRIEKLYDELQAVPADRGGPLELNSEGVYAAVSKDKKTNGVFEYSVKRVKERDLDEDHALDPISEEQFLALGEKLYTADKVVKYNTAEELRAFAATIED